MSRALLLIAAMALSLQAQTSKCYEFSMRGQGPELRIKATTDKADVIAKVEAELKQPIDKRHMISGRIASGNEGNFNWHWHFIPGEWNLADLATEVCDGTPQYVEDHRDDWIKNVKYYCPWYSYVSATCATTSLRAQGKAWESPALRAQFGRQAVYYRLPTASEATLELRAMNGSLAATLFTGSQSAGEHTAFFDARRVSRGVYRLVLQEGSGRVTSTVIVIP
jgi:hypothetical protein